MLRCTGRAYPHRPIRARPGRPPGAHLALPGPGLSRFLLLRRCGSRARTPARVSRSTSIWIFPEVGGGIPADPTLPIPSNAHWMPLASLVQLPFMAVLGPTAWASALPFALIGALAAPLTWAIARDAGARPVVAIGAGILIAIPVLTAAFMVQPDNFSLYQPLVARRAVDGRTRPEGVAEVLRPGRAAGRAGDAVAQRRAARPRSAGAGVPLGSLAPTGPSRGRPPSPASGCSCWSCRRGGSASWPCSARSRRRRRPARCCSSATSASGTASPRRRRSTTSSAWASGRCSPARLGGLVAAVDDLHGRSSPGSSWRRSWSSGRGPGAARSTSGRSSSTRSSCSRSRRWSRAVHVPGGTFIHSAVALAPHAYILALEGIARRRRVDRRAGAPGTREAATRVFTGAAVGVRDRRSGRRRRSFVHGDVGRPAGRVPGRRRRAGRGRAPHRRTA